MKRNGKTLKALRSTTIKEWVEKNTANLDDSDKLKAYPLWIKVMKSKGEDQMVMTLEKEINDIKERRANAPSLFKTIKNWFIKITKKGS